MLASRYEKGSECGSLRSAFFSVARRGQLLWLKMEQYRSLWENGPTHSMTQILWFVPDKSLPYDNAACSVSELEPPLIWYIWCQKNQDDSQHPQIKMFQNKTENTENTKLDRPASPNYGCSGFSPTDPETDQQPREMYVWWRELCTP